MPCVHLSCPKLTKLGSLALLLATFAIPLLLPVHARAEDVIAAGKEFVDLLAKQDFAAAVARYDATMKAALPEAKLRETWEGLQAQVGPFQKQLRARTEKVQGYDVVLVTCQFEKMALDTKVVFDSERKVAGLFFVPSQSTAESFGPPPYANTNAFREKEVKVGSGQWALSGTLTLPQGLGPWPAIVLVHGSGPQDRDETIGANKPFRDLAWGLATKGVAVLRYEKRTKEHSAAMAGMANKITLKEETVDDALSAVETLRKTEGIDPNRLFVLGHSLGGLAAPRIAQADPAIAGIVILAGSTRPLDTLIIEQTRYLTSLQGKPSPEAEAKLAETEALMAKVRKLTAADASSAEMIFGAGAAYWLALRSYDQVATAKALEQPILILQGARDYQVTEADLEGWKKGLGSRANVTYKLYPDLNHLFITGVGKSTPSEYEKPGHVAETVVSDIAAWVQKQRARK
jgi:dienelactone hydrolase